MTSNNDARWMRHAISLARRGKGTTSENPSVGCVIVDERGNLAGTGWTAPGGRPHGEVRALEMAGKQARGATAYVTLEPCAHHGKTPPCASALVEAGVKRVVIGASDPDPRVSGRGVEMLKSAGIDVIEGVLADEARAITAGFLNRTEKKRPYVILKMGISSDEKIAASPGARTPITGEKFWERVHLLRAQSDAIMIGAGTARIDDPSLTCRLPGLENRSPVRVVVGSGSNLQTGMRLSRTASRVPVWLLAGQTGSGEVPASADVKVLPVETRADSRIDLAHALDVLAVEGINQLLVEGGARIARSLLESDLADEVWFAQSPLTLGPEAVDALAGLPLSFVTGGERFILSSKEAIGDDTLRIYHRKT